MYAIIPRISYKLSACSISDCLSSQCSRPCFSYIRPFPVLDEAMSTTRKLRRRSSILLPPPRFPPRKLYLQQARESLSQSAVLRKTASCSRAREVLIWCAATMVDQACVSLLCFKLHRLSITLPPSYSSFWLYLPSCLLSDLLVTAALQICKGYLFESVPPEGYHKPNFPALTTKDNHWNTAKAAAE